MSPFRAALATVIATFVLLLIGGTVNPTGSSLACPDWPLCHGEIFPEFVHGVQFEHSHRLAAAAVSLTTLLLALVTWRSAGVPARARRLAWWLLPLVALQASLGAITVIFKLVTLVSTAHLAISMLFFMLTITTAWWLWRARDGDDEQPAQPRRAALVALVATYGQIILGGFMRHTGSGRACGADFPTCGGEWWPSLWAGRVNMLHRFGGVVVAVIVIACAIIVGRRAAAAGRRVAFAMACVAPALVLVQLVLGALVVTSAIALPQILSHFAVAILLLASWTLAFLDLGARVRTPRVAPEVPARDRSAQILA